MRFDGAFSGSRRINGVRNFRQALASPHPVVVPRFGAIHSDGIRDWGFAMNRFLAVVSLTVTLSGCAASLRNPDIADLQRHPSRYQDHTVSISGVVTTSWGLPLVPFRFYKVNDGTGEVTVLSEGLRMPATGERVRVKGRVQDVAVLGGRPIGLHLREEDLYIRR